MDEDGGPGATDFDAFFRAAYPAARQVAYRIVGSAAEAEDAAAEAFARALVSWRRVGFLAYREAWVLRVTSNVAIDALRRGQRRPDGEVAAAVGRVEDGSVLRATLVAALAALPRRQREVVVLRHLAGFGTAEVARALGVSEGRSNATATAGWPGCGSNARRETPMGGEWRSTEEMLGVVRGRGSAMAVRSRRRLTAALAAPVVLVVIAACVVLARAGGGAGRHPARFDRLGHDEGVADDDARGPADLDC